ncbi:MAG: flagellar biosynthesis regulator FlaF [Proteobacteria bacterium]|nr:flagellar biosynthesis regulator FlaF [Pseudomonadota bacterium]
MSETAAALQTGSRNTEYKVFDRVTKALSSSKDKALDDKDYQEALDSNRRLWQALEVDVSSTKNVLSDELKAKIISLAIWVDKHSAKVTRGEAKVQPLITVNQAIMEGLAA